MSTSSQLTFAELERLACLAEEAAEVIQIVNKIIRHGYESTHPKGGPTNRELLTAELGDLVCIKGMMIDAGDISQTKIIKASNAKSARIGTYLHHN